VTIGPTLHKVADLAEFFGGVVIVFDEDAEAIPPVHIIVYG